MNLKRITKIFGASPPLSRKDIAEYGKSSDASTQHSVESKGVSSSFEADAMEGWEAMDYDVSVMKNLDKKFMGSSNLGWYITASVVVAATVVTVILLNSDPEKNTNMPLAQSNEKLTELLEDQEVTLEQTDIILPDSISNLQDAPIELQIEPKKIESEFKEMKSEYKFKAPPVIEMIPLDEVRMQIRQVEPEFIKESKKAAELYLYRLKLVDYRKYRSKPTVKTKQVVLTGTPASKEGKESEEPVSEMKDIEIPYIEYLSKTMRKFSRGSYKNALSRFDIILETYKDDVNANFYSGLCLYNLGQYEEAIDRFLACRLSIYSNFDEEAQWMTAMSYEELGQDDKARTYFQKIIDQGGFYKKQAQAKMK
ncbi:MAG: tetratricopeptide repeat protein [bacterium]|nr:tetratricopeptide repeat protein [bacterium]